MGYPRLLNAILIFFFFCFFNTGIQSQAAFVNCLYVARFTIVNDLPSVDNKLVGAYEALAFEQVFRGALAVGREREGELTTTNISIEKGDAKYTDWRR